MADKTAVTDKTAASSDAANVAAHGTGAELSSASLRDCRAASSAMSSKCDAKLNNLTITNDTTSNSASGAGTLDRSSAQVDTTHRTGGMVVAHETMERSQAALKNTEAYMLASDTSAADKLKSAGVLAANGIKELKGADGTQYSISLDKDNNVQLKTTDLKGKSFDVSAQLSASGGEILKSSSSELLNASEKIAHPPLPERDTNHPPDATQKPTGKDALFDPSLSQEDKLKAARDMADHGQRRFKGPDGKDYEINTQKFGNKESVTIFQGDGKGHSHVMMRGIVDDHGNVTQQHNKKGAVDIESDYAKKHGGADNPLLRHNEAKHDAPVEGDKLQGTPEDQKHLKDSRERLQKDAKDNISNSQDRDKFTADMNALEARAKTQPLSAKEVADTYDNLSKLLEAKNGAVDKDTRLLAAETFAHHMGNPQAIDQGNHNTCNVTSLEEHLITRNPSKAADIVASMATNGNWTAPDGKQIKIDADSLTPRGEEKNNPPIDGQRSYATQLLNLALVNDQSQRKIPPEFYSQGQSRNRQDTGERLKYADGTDVTNDDTQHNGDKTPVNAPGLSCDQISREGTSINGEGKFVITNGKVDNSDSLVKVNSADDLRQSLADMKANGKFPVIIMVDSNTQAFGGNPSNGPGWHVVSITGYDAATGKAHISNQWGSSADRDMSVDDLYRSTYTN